MHSVPRIAIIGRPNVGKSSLFNRIVGRRHSITEKVSGTTRDRISALVKKDGVTFEIIDTGGFDMGTRDHISRMIKRQIEVAISAAHAILFVCDGQQGVMPQDQELLPLLRKSGADIVVAVNKIDNEKIEGNLSEFYAFGIQKVYAVSALHNRGISSLIDGLMQSIKPGSAATLSDEAIRVAIVGRPNVGKSSFLNKVADEERVIVHEAPGTTRDSIDVSIERDSDHFVFIDTAGMRHKRKVKEAVDVYSLLRAQESARRSDVCLVMIDAYEGLTRDDIRILALAEDLGKGCVLLVNKWDLISGVTMVQYEKALVKRMEFARHIPVLFTSCKTGLNIEEIFRLIMLVANNSKAQFSRQELDRILDIIYKTHRIPHVRSGELIKVYEIRQKGNAPVTFALFVNKPNALTDDYLEAFKNVIREELGLRGVAIRLHVTGKAKKKGR